MTESELAKVREWVKAYRAHSVFRREPDESITQVFARLKVSKERVDRAFLAVEAMVAEEPQS